MMHLLIPAMLLFFSGGFGLYSMHKNDAVINNKFLFLHGWFFFVGVAICFLYYMLQIYISTGHAAYLNYYTDNFFSPIMALVFCVGFVLFGLYLFSLSRKCMMPQYLPRTAKIFLRKKFRKLLAFFKIKYYCK